MAPQCIGVMKALLAMVRGAAVEVLFDLTNIAQ